MSKGGDEGVGAAKGDEEFDLQRGDQRVSKGELKGCVQHWGELKGLINKEQHRG